MSFDARVTAEELAKFLRSNDGNRETLELTEDSYVDFDDWTDDQLDEVVEAAKTNTSLRTFSINVDNLAPDEGNIAIAETIASFVRHLKGLRSVEIYDTHKCVPAPVAVFDALLRGIVTGDATDVTCLRLSSANLSPGLFTQFAERFPSLEALALSGPCSRLSAATTAGTCGCPHCANAKCRQCSNYGAFATEVAIAASRHLRSLRRFALETRHMVPSLAVLLSDVGGAASATLKELRIVVGMSAGEDNERKRLQEAVARFCAVTRSVEILKIFWRDDSPNAPPLLDVRPMFRFWSRHPLSDSIREIHFDRCVLRGATAYEGTLKKLYGLRLTNAQLDPALHVLKNLPQLKSFHSTYKELPEDDENEIERESGFLDDNRSLEVFCEAVERQDSALEDIEIDLVGGYGTYERFAASERLLRACKGRLVVNFESLPVHSCHDIVRGLTSLRADLKELRIRFAEGHFSDSQYGRIVDTVQRNKTLTVFELGLDLWYGKDATITRICELVSTNDRLDTLSLVGLGSISVVRLLDQLLPILASSTTTTKLRSLQLHGTDLTDDWCRLKDPLLSMLDKNRVLSELNGCTIPWNDPAASRVRHLLKLNNYGRRFLPPHNIDDDDDKTEDGARPKVPTGLWGTILSRIAKDKECGVMYAFLHAKLVTLLHDSAYNPPAPSSSHSTTRAAGRKRRRPEEEDGVNVE